MSTMNQKEIEAAAEEVLEDIRGNDCAGEVDGGEVWKIWLDALTLEESVRVCQLAERLLPQFVVRPEYTRYAEHHDRAVIASALRLAAGWLRQIGYLKGPLPEEMPIGRLNAPVPMRTPCPQCHALHIDEGEFATKPHHTHACQFCGEV